MKNLTRKAFTLIELLIVIAIIGVLAVTVIMTLNPGEAQKKSRDVQRVKDATTLQAAIEQLIDSGVAIPTVDNSLGDVTGTATQIGAMSTDATGATDCNASWFGAGVDVCAFVNKVPIDPSNGLTRAASNGTSATATVPTQLFYRAIVATATGTYEIGVRQESATNWTKMRQDGGEDNDWYEVFSNNALF